MFPQATFLNRILKPFIIVLRTRLELRNSASHCFSSQKLIAFQDCLTVQLSMCCLCSDLSGSLSASVTSDVLYNTTSDFICQHLFLFFCRKFSLPVMPTYLYRIPPFFCFHFSVFMFFYSNSNILFVSFSGF